MASIGLFAMEFDNEEKVEIDVPFLTEEMEKELKQYLLEQQVEGDSTDGPFDLIESLTNRLQEDFDEIIGEDNNKKSFIKSLTHIFALLLNKKVDSVNKIKVILKIVIKTMLKIWSGRNLRQNVGPEQVGYHLG